MQSKGFTNMNQYDILTDTAAAAVGPPLHFRWSLPAVQPRRGVWGPTLLQWFQRLAIVHHRQNYINVNGNGRSN